MVEKTQTSFECCPQNRRLEGFIGKTIRESVLHGVKYLVTPNLHYSERIYWIFAVAASFGYAIFLVLDLVDKYNQNPLILSFQSKETQVSQIAFPAITICNVNILKGDVIRNTVFDYRRRREEGLAKNITAGQLLDIDPEFRAMFTDILQFGQFCFQAKSFRRYMNEKIVDIKGYPDYVLQINDYIMSRDDTAYDGIYKFLDSYSDELGDLYKHATHNCQDMILKCMWEENELPCHKMFFEINTRHGRCCVFNMMPKYILGNLLENDTRKLEEESRLPNLAIEEWKRFNLSDMLLSEESTVQTSYPRRQKAGGKPFGLSLLLNPQLDLYSACNTNDALGLKMVAHSPISFPSIMDMGMPIAPSSEVFVDIEPKITISNDDLSSVDIEKRSCYLSGEIKLKGYKFYSAENCQEECIATFMYQNCSCIRYDMPRNASQKLCGAKDANCVARVRKEATGISGRCSFCLPPCTEIKYKLDQTKFPLRENYSSIIYNTPSEGNKTASNYSIVHIYFGQDTLYATERKSLYDASALIANAGGLLGLTLGFSVLALLELIYYFTLGAWFKYKAEEDTMNASPQAGNKRTFRPPSSMLNGKNDPTVVSETEFYNWAERRAQLLRHIKPDNNSVSPKMENNGLVSNFNPVSVTKRTPYPYLC